MSRSASPQPSAEQPEGGTGASAPADGHADAAAADPIAADPAPDSGPAPIAADPAPDSGSTPEPAPESDLTAEPAPAPAPRSARVVFCTAVLTLEAFVVLFATLVGFGLQLVEPRSLIWAFGGIGVLVCLVAAGMAARRAGLVVGSVVQAGLILAGLAIPMMFIIGIVFAIIWVVALLLGARIDRERAERAEAEAAAGNDPAT